VYLEVFLRLLPGLGRQGTLGYLLEHFPQLLRHCGKPVRIAVRVGVQVIEEAVLHLVVALRVRERVVGLAEMPLSGEISLVTALLEHRRQRPFRGRQTAALPLECYRGHAAPVGYTPGLNSRAARCTARLTVKREEGHPFV